MAKLTLSDMQAIAKTRKGKCLSAVYVNAQEKLVWSCEKSHNWEATPESIRSGRWCPECAGNRKKNIQDMHDLAARKQGRCLSKNYVNRGSKLLWQCKEGHKWEAIPANISKGNWCPYCSKRIKKTIEEMQVLAAKKGGKCLSETYVNKSSKLQWQCKMGHIWNATADHVSHGTWCPYCHGRHKTVEYLRQLAEKKGGRCLAEEYTTAHTKVRWQCGRGHIWKTSATAIQGSSWCPYCARKRITIKDVRKLARDRGGKCLSKKYVNARGKLVWQCRKGHKWSEDYGHIYTGRWCPFCAGKRKTIQDMQRLARAKNGICLSGKYVHSHTKLSWQCSEGHRWRAVPSSIISGTWCAKCARSKLPRKPSPRKQPLVRLSEDAVVVHGD